MGDGHHRGRRFLWNGRKVAACASETLSHPPFLADLVKKIKAYYKHCDDQSWVAMRFEIDPVVRSLVSEIPSTMDSTTCVSVKPCRHKRHKLCQRMSREGCRSSSQGGTRPEWSGGKCTSKIPSIIAWIMYLRGRGRKTCGEKEAFGADHRRAKHPPRTYINDMPLKATLGHYQNRTPPLPSINPS